MSRRPAGTGDKLPTEDPHFITTLTISEPTRHHWAIAQSTDPDTAIVYDHQLNGRHRPTDSELRGSSDSARIVRSHWAHLLMEKDLLFFKDDTHSQPRLVVPGSLVLPILDDLHRELGHLPLPICDDYQPDAYVLELQETLRTTHNLARTHLESAYTRQKAYFDQHVSGTSYAPGDLVLRYRPTSLVGTSSKFFHPWEGPFVVIDFFPPSTYTIRDAQSAGGPVLTVHYGKLKPYRGRLPNATADTLPILPPHLVPQPSDEVGITSSPFQAAPLRTEPPLEGEGV
ncbi:hypothetical protein SprV_0100095800 [Sparganum proliferum]